MKIGRNILIFIIITSILVIGGCSNVSNGNIENDIDCNIGNSRFTPIPEGISAGGQITGIEKHSFVNGESLDLCCSDASTLQGDLNYKSCILTRNNTITHEILWKKDGSNLIKVKEVEPQFGSVCTYEFNLDGSIKNRSCF